MAKCYVELRRSSARGSESVAADMMRHLHTRQHLGKALIICEHPAIVLSAARKQWLKLARTVQKQRASTLNADKILKYTHTITHMQHMVFTAKTALEDLEADVYFARSIDIAPTRCFTVYVTTPINEQAAAELIGQLPAEALIVTYDHLGTAWHSLGLQPKRVLEEQIVTEWKHVQQFLQTHHIDTDTLFHGPLHNIEVMDDALDILLGTSSKFLQVAGEFQRSLELARPLRITKETRRQYDTLSLLAHRVQALSPTTFTQRFLETYNEDDTFFLYDAGKQQVIFAGDLASAIAYHMRAGRRHLAHALRSLA